MPVAKRRVATPAQRAIADRVARARAANPPRDPTGACHAALADLAASTGRDIDELLEWFDERAGVREYDGNVSRDEAERAAVKDVVDICDPQRRFA